MRNRINNELSIKLEFGFYDSSGNYFNVVGLSESNYCSDRSLGFIDIIEVSNDKLRMILIKDETGVYYDEDLVIDLGIELWDEQQAFNNLFEFANGRLKGQNESVILIEN